MRQYLIPLLVISLTACTSTATQPAQIDPPFPPPGSLAASSHIYPVESGWFNGTAVQYYNLGTNTPLNPDDPTRVRVEPVWKFISGQNADGTPIDFPDQHGLFNTTVGDANYSDLWQPFFVTPPTDYVAETITSADQILNSNFPIEKQAFFVNCPIVPAGSSLADSDKPLKLAWVNGVQVAYFDFGPTSARPGNVYVFITGFDQNNQPVLVSGQHFIFDHDRNESGYSDFWIVQWVQVGADYQPDSVRTVSALPGKIIPSTLVVNYPLH